MRLEKLAAGMVAVVNGREMEGPCVIVREWRLNAVAVCPVGADPNTVTQFSANHPGEPVEVVLVTTEAGSSTPEPAATASELTALTREQFAETLARFTAEFGTENGSEWAAAGLTYEAALESHRRVSSAAHEPVGTAGESTTLIREQFAATLAQFVAEFGQDNGSEWAAAGLTHEAALERQCDVLSAKLESLRAAKDADLARLEHKLAALDLEEMPPRVQEVDHARAASSRPTDLAMKIGPNLAKFAQGIKLPKAE
jgi:hypothetical protein